VHKGAEDLLSKYLPDVTNIFVFAPGAEFGPAKQWPSSHMSNLANQLLDQYPHHGIFILGSLKDTRIAVKSSMEFHLLMPIEFKTYVAKFLSI
jgi:heptosyltransferase-2